MNDRLRREPFADRVTRLGPEQRRLVSCAVDGFLAHHAPNQYYVLKACDLEGRDYRSVAVELYGDPERAPSVRTTLSRAHQTLQRIIPFAYENDDLPY